MDKSKWPSGYDTCVGNPKVQGSNLVPTFREYLLIILEILLFGK